MDSMDLMIDSDMMWAFVQSYFKVGKMVYTVTNTK